MQTSLEMVGANRCFPEGDDTSRLAGTRRVDRSLTITAIAMRTADRIKEMAKRDEL